MSHKSMPDQTDHDRGVRSEERLCSIDAKWIAHAEVHELEQRALRLQHEEYERRLDDLNHEAARIAADKATFASREMVDGSVRELNQKLERNTELLAAALPREVYDERHEALQDRVKEMERSALPREVFDSTQKDVILKAEALATAVAGKPSSEQHEALEIRVGTIEQTRQLASEAAAIHLRSDERIKQLEDWKNKATGAAVILTLVAGAVGAVIVKALGGT